MFTEPMFIGLLEVTLEGDKLRFIWRGGGPADVASVPARSFMKYGLLEDDIRGMQADIETAVRLSAMESAA
jgi:hypothetical protein